MEQLQQFGFAQGYVIASLVSFIASGLSVMLEIAVFGILWIGIMYFMASRYLATKYHDEKAQVSFDA